MTKKLDTMSLTSAQGLFESKWCNNEVYGIEYSISERRHSSFELEESTIK